VFHKTFNLNILPLLRHYVDDDKIDLSIILERNNILDNAGAKWA
jgi:hypothetical protein